MSIFLNKNSKIIVQGMIGSERHKHTMRILAYDTKTVTDTNPKKAGTSIDFDITPYGPLADQFQGGAINIPVYGTVAEVKAATDANTSVIFVPPVATKGAILEVVDAGLNLVMVITERIPVQGVNFVLTYARGRRVRVIGSNCSGIISSGKPNVRATPRDITPQGHLGLMSRFGILTHQMIYELRDLGFIICIGIGGDPIIGTTHIDALAVSEQDPETRLIMMIGEIGGSAEECAAAHIKEHVTKPVAAYVADSTAPEGKTMGRVEAIVPGSSGTAAVKKETLETVGVKVGRTPPEVAQIAREIMSAR